MATRRKLTRAQKIMAWWKARRARVAALWPIAAMGALAAYVSYGHIMYVTAQNISSAHNLPGVPLIMPIIVDVLMFACARYVKRAPTTAGRLLGAAGFAIGLAASLAANMMASDPGTAQRIVATWPAIALLIVALVFEFGNRRPMSAAQIAKRVIERNARKAARKGIRPTPNAPQSPPVAAWAAEGTDPDVPGVYYGTAARHGVMGTAR